MRAATADDVNFTMVVTWSIRYYNDEKRQRNVLVGGGGWQRNRAQEQERGDDEACRDEDDASNRRSQALKANVIGVYKPTKVYVLKFNLG